jgi:hypothetical protein
MFVGSFVASMGHIAYDVMSARLGYMAPHVSVETAYADPFGQRTPVDEPLHAGGSAVLEACAEAGCGDAGKECLGGGHPASCLDRLGAGDDGNAVCLADQLDCGRMQSGEIPPPPRTSPCWCSTDAKKLKFYTRYGCVCNEFTEYAQSTRTKQAPLRIRAGDPE